MPIQAVSIPGRVPLRELHRLAPDRFPLLLETTTGSPEAVGAFDLLLGAAREPPVVNPRALTLLDSLHPRLQKNDSSAPSHLPFVGGWALYASYELAGQFEPRLRLPVARGLGRLLPKLWLQRCDHALIHDRAAGCSWLIAEAGATVNVAELQQQIILATQKKGAQTAPTDSDTIEEEAPAIFLQGVERIREYIQAGDVFQVNLSRKWRGRSSLTPDALYSQLVLKNPAPFAALARLGNTSIVSSSPERLVRVQDGMIDTRPIAGTRPRGADPAAERRGLVAHPKERAEHIMLVDLERNDLGRICKPGSVRVDELMTLESYAHVHHIVSNVRGELRSDWTPAAVLRALFPGGTITGCPKIRCMEIIAELEGEGRGAYTGALGFLDHRGHMDLNILIRSITMANGEFEFRTGAGIVADSSPARELEETRAKARGLLSALGMA